MTRFTTSLLTSLLSLTIQLASAATLTAHEPATGAPVAKTADKPAASPTKTRREAAAARPAKKASKVAAPSKKLRPAAVAAPATPAAKPLAPRTLDGYIHGADGLALPGVTARVAGTQTLVVSNADGMFRLPLPTDGKPVRLVCSYAGLADCEVVVKPQEQVMFLEMWEKAELSSTPKRRR